MYSCIDLKMLKSHQVFRKLTKHWMLGTMFQYKVPIVFILYK